MAVARTRSASTNENSKSVRARPKRAGRASVELAVAPRPKKNLDPVLSFLRMLWAVDHGLGRISKKLLATMGITAEQRMILRFVGSHGTIAAGELARLLHVDAGTISASLRRLEEQGLVTRARGEGDGRRVEVELTRRGKSFDLPAKNTAEDAVARALANTSPRDVASAVRVLEEVIAQLATLHEAK
jgi:DNA-binding MarR family transcriptional regulator